MPCSSNRSSERISRMGIYSVSSVNLSAIPQKCAQMIMSASFRALYKCPHDITHVYVLHSVCARARARARTHPLLQLVSLLHALTIGLCISCLHEQNIYAAKTTYKLRHEPCGQSHNSLYPDDA